jgi:hypothetical protein
MDATTEQSLVSLLESMAEQLKARGDDTAYLFKVVTELLPMFSLISGTIKDQQDMIQSLQRQVNSLHRSLDIAMEGFR